MAEQREQMKHILGMEPEGVLRQIIRARFAGYRGGELAINTDDIVAIAMEFNKWLVDTNETFQKLVLDKIDTELPQPIVAASQEPRQSEQSGKLRELLIRADSIISLIRHRAESRIPWGSLGMCELREVDELIGVLRKAYADKSEQEFVDYWLSKSSCAPKEPTAPWKVVDVCPRCANTHRCPIDCEPPAQSTAPTEEKCQRRT